MNKYMYDVTYIVASFNPSLKKMLMTLNSILLQTKVNKQIIIVDDGSLNDCCEEVKSYFATKGFQDYIFLSSTINVGTVSNIYRCKDYIDSNYIKLISPGDCMYGKDTSWKWIKYMSINSIDASFCDYYCYSNIDEFKVVERVCNPYSVSQYINRNDKRIIKRILIYNDLWLGATVMTRGELFFDYLSQVNGVVRYGEDNIYRMMAAAGCKLGYFPYEGILYEVDTGVSSKSVEDDKWHERLMDDWVNTNRIIMHNCSLNIRQYKEFKYVCEWKAKHDVRRSNIKKIGLIKLLRMFTQLYVRYPEMFFYHMGTLICNRKTSTSIDKNYIRMLRDYS